MHNMKADLKHQRTRIPKALLSDIASILTSLAIILIKGTSDLIGYEWYLLVFFTCRCAFMTLPCVIYPFRYLHLRIIFLIRFLIQTIIAMIVSILILLDYPTEVPSVIISLLVLILGEFSLGYVYYRALDFAKRE